VVAVRLTAIQSLSCWQALPAALQAWRLMNRLSRSYRSKGCSWARKMSPALWRSPFVCHKRPAPALRRKPAQSLLRSRIFFRTCQFPFKNGQGTDFRSARLQFIRPAGFHHEKDAHQPVGILRMAETPPAVAFARFSRRGPRKQTQSPANSDGTPGYSAFLAFQPAVAHQLQLLVRIVPLCTRAGPLAPSTLDTVVRAFADPVSGRTGFRFPDRRDGFHDNLQSKSCKRSNQAKPSKWRLQFGATRHFKRRVGASV
jgi:hypothetical protein